MKNNATITIIQLAEKYQHKLHKQAQQEFQATMQYLMRAVPLAAFNGAKVSNAIVTRVDLPKENGIIDTYVSNIPEAKMQAVKDALNKQLAGQKPELAGKINLHPAGY